MKFRNLTELPGVDIFWKRPVSGEFLANWQSFHTRKFVEITVFYAVVALPSSLSYYFQSIFYLFEDRCLITYFELA